jgi:hypothetical protein
MRSHKRLPRLALELVVLVGALAAVVLSRKERESISQFLLQAPPPQSATGDFDGDGRIDTALIRDGRAGRSISIQLSTDASVVQLEASVIGIVEGDIDHDGDLDLVASTVSGDLLIWLNDGRGRFTRKTVPNGPGLSGEPIFVQTVWPESMAVGVRGPSQYSTARTQVTLRVIRARPPTRRFAVVSPAHVLLAFRAPPALSV